jgi:hypothetical protein
MKALNHFEKVFEKFYKKLAKGLPPDQKLARKLNALVSPHVLDSKPEAIFFMSNPSKEIQLKSLRASGKLLICKSDWTIDTEAELPGSTAFKEFVQPRMELCKVDKNNVPLRQDVHGKRKPSKADFMWEPIRKLSMLPAADITETDRAILRNLPYPEAVLHIQYLLDKNASPQREAVTVVTPELQASFNHCMATASESDCANDDVMVIKA